jgi:ubiquinone/menaquinone biosynthesis C-methylase UbiE
MSATDRLSIEQAFHNRQALQRAETFAGQPEALTFTDNQYLDHETWIRPAFRELGSLGGRTALDFGCGHGMAAIVMARCGARVTAFDLSAGYLSEARRRAQANATAVDFVLADGERLPFSDACFDCIWGNAILHHLDLGIAGPEVARVLRPDGIAVFCEPWGENPLLNWARRHVAYSAKNRTPDEQPLGRCHLRMLQQSFSQVTVRGFQLLAMARRVLPPGRLVRGLQWCDAHLLARAPALERFCRYVVIMLRR